MIYTVTLNPAVDKTVYVDDFMIDSVNRASRVRQDAGGKGVNVSKTIKVLGGTSTAVTLLGGAAGSFIASALAALDIPVVSFDVPGQTRTNTKIVDLAQRTYTDVNEPGPEVTQELLDDALALLASRIRIGDIVVLSGSLPTGAPVGTYADWTRTCREAGARVFLDADGEALRYGLDAHPYLIKPNDIELGRHFGRELDTDGDIVSAARTLIEGGVDTVMVSMGGAGAILVTAEVALRLRQPTVPVASTVGAGDSVVASLAYALERDLSLADAGCLAMAVGAATVMQPGAEPARRADIDSLLQQVTMESIRA